MRTALADPAADVVFQVEQVDAHVGELAELGQDLGDELPGGVHPLDLCGRLQLDHGNPHALRWYNNTNVTLAVLKYQPCREAVAAVRSRPNRSRPAGLSGGCCVKREQIAISVR